MPKNCMIKQMIQNITGRQMQIMMPLKTTLKIINKKFWSFSRLLKSDLYCIIVEMKKVVVITGASSGLGKEIARLFIVKKEYYLVLTGRNKNGLDEFRDNPNVSIITGDITR